MGWISDIGSYLEHWLGFLGIVPATLGSMSGETVGGMVTGGLIGVSVAWLIARAIYRRGGVDIPASGRAAQDAAASQLSADQYHLLFDSTPVATFVCDTRRGRLLEANAAAVSEYGYSREELLKMSLSDLGMPADAERFAAAVANLGATGPDAGTWRHRKKDGTMIDAELSVFRAQFARQQARIFVARDVTRRKHMEAVLWQDVERYGLLSKATGDALLDWDVATDRVWGNVGCQALFDGAADSVPRTMNAWFDHIHVDDRGRVQQRLIDLMKSGEDRWNEEFRLMRRDQSVTHVFVRGVVVRGEDGAALRMMVSLQDITARKEAEDRTRFLADHDELTGLPNRSLFRHSVNLALLRAERSGKMLSILFFDLDRFKNINDSLGHDAGDEVLRAVAERLRNCVRKADLVARFGGDEFAVLTEGLTAEDQAGTVARKILDALSKPIMLAGRQYRPMASIGISTYPTDGRDAPSLQKNADIAMYRAKEEGRGTFKFYSEQLNTHSIQRLEFESNLSQALNQREFVLYYQPKVDLASGRVTGLEALIRWVSPTLGFVPPGEFIQIAEETGLIVPIGRWIVQTACVQNRAWQKGGLPHLRVAVNISARQLADKGLVDLIKDTMEKTGLAPESLELEITESVVMDNQEHAEKVLNELKDLGLHLTMDDFGTGYSSLAYLKRFPFDSVKIDQSFVRGIPESADDAAIIEAIVAMARSLQLKVVAEGVETEQQFDFLRKLGCDYIQGYYFSKPIPSNEVVMMLYKTMTRDAAQKEAAS